MILYYIVLYCIILYVSIKLRINSKQLRIVLQLAVSPFVLYTACATVKTLINVRL